MMSTLENLQRRVARLERQASEGRMIYTTPEQCDMLRCDYYKPGAEFVVSADALIRTNREYDRSHKEYLQTHRANTLMLKRTSNCGPGWWEVVGMI